MLAVKDETLPFTLIVYALFRFDTDPIEELLPATSKARDVELHVIGNDQYLWKFDVNLCLCCAASFTSLAASDVLLESIEDTDDVRRSPRMYLTSCLGTRWTR